MWLLFSHNHSLIRELRPHNIFRRGGVGEAPLVGPADGRAGLPARKPLRYCPSNVGVRVILCCAPLEERG